MANKRRRRRGRGFVIFLLILLAAAWFVFDQQTRIQTEEIQVFSPRLPAGFDGFRVVQLSDLHGAQFGAGNEALLKNIAALKPDLIAITGDIMDSPAQLDRVPALAKALAAIAPTYYVTGNHEWAARSAKEVKTLLSENGVIPLSNEYVTLERDGETIVLAGIDDPNGLYGQKTPEQLTEEIRAALGDPYILLLAHRNEYYETYSDCGVDVTLCGHAHGGLIRLPFTDGLLGNDRRFFPDHTAGLYPLESGQLVVSRGLGNNTVPIPSIRLFNRPHLPVVVLRTGSS